MANVQSPPGLSFIVLGCILLVGGIAASVQALRWKLQDFDSITILRATADPASLVVAAGVVVAAGLVALVAGIFMRGLGARTPSIRGRSA